MKEADSASKSHQGHVGVEPLTSRAVTEQASVALSHQIHCGLHWQLQKGSILVATAVSYFDYRVIQLGLNGPQ